MQKGRVLIIDDNEDEHITPVHDIILFLIKAWINRFIINNCHSPLLLIRSQMSRRL